MKPQFSTAHQLASPAVSESRVPRRYVAIPHIVLVLLALHFSDCGQFSFSKAHLRANIPLRSSRVEVYLGPGRFQTGSVSS